MKGNHHNVVTIGEAIMNGLVMLLEQKLECGPMPNVMAAQWNIGGAVCESSVNAFLVPCRKVADPAAGVSCSNASNIGERKTWTQSEFCTWRRQGARVARMYIQCSSPGGGQTSCKVWLASGKQNCCSNKAKTRNPLNLLGCPKLANISAASGPKFAILWEHVEDILLFNKFFSIVDTCLSCEDSARQNCAMVRRWRFLRNFCVLYFQRVVCSMF